MTKRRNNLISNPSQTTMKIEIDKRTVSKAETLYISLMCFVASCLSFATLEVGARSPLGHSVTQSTTFNVLFRRNYNTKINIPTGNCVSALMSTVVLALGEKFRIPYLYLPWMANTLRGMVFHEGPALLGFLYNQLPYAVIPASTFAFITSILFVEELCLWCDVFASFKRCWLEYMHRKRDKTNEKTANFISSNIKEFELNNKEVINDLEEEKNIYDITDVTNTFDESTKIFQSTDPRRVRSLIDANNYLKDVSRLLIKI